MKKYQFVLIALFSFSILSTTAQNSIINGQITTFDNVPVQRVEVVAKKSKTKVYSDSLGFFSIECNPKDKLVIKASGFKSKQVKLKNIKDLKNIKIDISIDKDDSDMILSNGHIGQTYLAATRKHLATIKRYSFGFNNMTDLLKGKFPQLTVTGNEVIMRGNSSNGNNGALFVLSGSTYSWSHVNTIDVSTIKNIEILTGSAAHRYGPGSGNGVIRIDLLSD